MLNLELEHNIFVSNNKSHLKISKDYLRLLSKQFRDSRKKPIKNEQLYVERSSHLANAEWLLFNSVYVALVALFEHQLSIIANHIQKKNISRIKLLDLKGDGITRFFSYFELIGEIVIIDKKGQEWEKLKHFIETRNRIVHSDGIIESKNLETTNLFKFLTKQGVKITGRGDSGQIRIRDLIFLKLFSDFAISISKKLIKEINKKFK